jgi:hypothetical protein
MKKLLIGMFGLLLSLIATPAAAATFNFVINETTGGTSSFFASFQLSGSPSFDDGTRIAFSNVAVTFANGNTVTVDFVSFFDSPDGGITLFDNGSFLLSTMSEFDQQTFERDGQGNFSTFTEFSSFSLVGDDPDAGGPADFSNRTFTLSITQAVPEPDTWAMMILGFGLAGYALRRRRRDGSGIDSRPELQPAL